MLARNPHHKPADAPALTLADMVWVEPVRGFHELCIRHADGSLSEPVAKASYYAQAFSVFAHRDFMVRGNADGPMLHLGIIEGAGHAMRAAEAAISGREAA